MLFCFHFLNQSKSQGRGWVILPRAGKAERREILGEHGVEKQREDGSLMALLSVLSSLCLALPLDPQFHKVILLLIL